MTKQQHPIARYALTITLFSCCAISNAAENTSPPAPELANAIWTWAEKSGNEHAIFISRKAGTSWEQPQKISTNEGINIVPAVTKTADDNLMVIWSNYTGSSAQLRYRQLKGGLWSEEKEYYTGLSANMAPSQAVDKAGKLWVVWAGFNGVSDEIYYTTWNGTAFATGTAITNNDVPDILPVMGIDEKTGTPWIQWQQFSEKGYVKFETTWSGTAWTSPVLVPNAAPATVSGQQANTSGRILALKKASTTTNLNEQTTTKNAQEDLEIEIPKFISDPAGASIHIPGYAVQSLALRGMLPAK